MGLLDQKSLNNYGIWLGKFYLCKYCAANGGSPELKNKTTLSEHIKNVHQNSDTEDKCKNVNRVNDFVNTNQYCTVSRDHLEVLLLKEIKKRDYNFNTLIDIDFLECLSRIRFLIGSMKNLTTLQYDSLFTKIEQFYSNSNHQKSLVEYDYIIETKNEFEVNLKAFNVLLVNDDVQPNKNEDDEEEFEIGSKITHGEQSFRDVTLACEDKKFKTQRDIISSPGPEFDFTIQSKQTQMLEYVYNNLSEELIKEMTEELYLEISGEIFKTKSEENINLYENDFKEEILSSIVKVYSDSDCKDENKFQCDIKIEHKNLDQIEVVKNRLYKYDGVSNKFNETHIGDQKKDFNLKNYHVNSKFTDKFLECDICELSFENEDQLEEHKHEMNVEEEEQFVYDDFDDFYENVIQPEIIKLLQKHGIDDTISSLNDTIDVDFDDSLIFLTCEEPTETLVNNSFTCYVYSIQEEINNAEENLISFGGKCDTNNLGNKQGDQDVFSALKIEKHENKIKYKKSCNQWKFKLKNKDRMKKLYETDHENSPDSCDECNYKSKVKCKSKGHTETGHNGTICDCNQCDYKFKQVENTKLHVKSTHQRSSFVCDHCKNKSKDANKYLASDDEQEIETKYKNKKRRKRKNEWKRRRKKQTGRNMTMLYICDLPSS